MHDFKSAIQQPSISPSENIIADGKLHCFHVERDKSRTENGWYVLHDNSPAGVFRCWKRGIPEQGTALAVFIKTVLVWILIRLPYCIQPFAGFVVRTLWPSFRRW